MNQVEGVQLPGLATLEVQEEEIYLLQKLLQKSSAILKEVSDDQTTQGNIAVSTVAPVVTDYPTQEKQEESLALLRRILAKMTAMDKVED